MSIAWNIHTYTQLPSTQDYVRELAEEGLPEGTVVQAMTQTKGRGRQGRNWISPLGNLYMSFILQPNCTPAVAGQISFVAALAVSAAIDEVIAPGYKKTLKWPNDILIDGKKCAGILIESILDKKNQLRALAVGIGVNILSTPEHAIGLQQVGKGDQIPIHPFRDLLLSHISAYYNHWKDKGFSDIRNHWLAQAHGRDGPVRVTLSDGVFEGIFKDLDKDGALVVTLPDGTERRVNAGDVFFDI